MPEPRYRVGCAGMFVLGMDYGMHDEDEAIVACGAGPAGCEVYDTVTGKWIGPGHPEARARLEARASEPPTRWEVRLCELGDDLRFARCHIAARCSTLGLGCNQEGHYCCCESFVVERVDA